MMNSILVKLAEKGEVVESKYPTIEYLEVLNSRHLDSPECWCFPTLDFVNPDTGQELWVHHQPN